MTSEFKRGDILVKIGCLNRYVVFSANKHTYFLSGQENDFQHAFGILKRECHNQYVKVGRWNDKNKVMGRQASSKQIREGD